VGWVLLSDRLAGRAETSCSRMLALRHQLGVLARSNRRFCLADRLFWLLLRWLWPGWPEALVLIQPATVDRWHREGLRRCWYRRSRRSGRPRIDSTCRDLIRRMAAENCLWGAPRIHVELLKVGITISERTVSRYLRGRPTTRSQTWRTFFANHFGGQTFLPRPVIFADAHDADIVVDDASDLSSCPALSIDASCACFHRPSVDWRRSLQPSSLDARLGHNHFQDHTGARKGCGRDPPPPAVATSLVAAAPCFLSYASKTLRDRAQYRINLPACTWPYAVMSLNSV
jgi:hypothetical protein